MPGITQNNIPRPIKSLPTTSNMPGVCEVEVTSPLAAANMSCGRAKLSPEVGNLVNKALTAVEYDIFHKSVETIARRGGMDGVHGLCRILEAVIANELNLTSIPSCERYVPIYTVCKHLLYMTNVRNDSKFLPTIKLSKEERREVLNLIKQLAIGEHRDLHLCHGARGALFDHATDNTITGALVGKFLSFCQFIKGQEASIRVLHVLTDLPWAFRSKLGFASYKNRMENTLSAVLERIQEAARSKK